jgi:ubiquitin-conjugating enzyme E2 M
MVKLLMISLLIEAAEVLATNRRLFEQNVYKSMRGGYVGSTYFERCLKN